MKKAGKKGLPVCIIFSFLFFFYLCKNRILVGKAEAK